MLIKSVECVIGMIICACHEGIYCQEQARRLSGSMVQGFLIDVHCGSCSPCLGRALAVSRCGQQCWYICRDDQNRYSSTSFKSLTGRRLLFYPGQLGLLQASRLEGSSAAVLWYSLESASSFHMSGN